jgi:hypothetical protein
VHIKTSELSRVRATDICSQLTAQVTAIYLNSAHENLEKDRGQNGNNKSIW